MRRLPRNALAVLATAALGAMTATGRASSLPAPRATAAPKLLVAISVDGLSWQRLVSYRPWYEAGLKRLLDEGLVETSCRYRHINTETGPGHSSLATGAPPRVTGIVANRWFERNPDGSVRSVYCTDQAVPFPVPGTPPLFYREVEKDGRLYVFAVARGLEAWEASGELGRGISRTGYGPSGETVVFDGDDAIRLYDFRHGLPPETFKRADVVAGPGNLRVSTLADRLVERSPRSRAVSLSAKDRSAIFMAGRNPGHSVFWYDQDTGRFATSAAYDPPVGAKAVVAAFNKSSAGAMLPARFGLLWRKLPAPVDMPGVHSARPAPAPDLLDYQLPSNGLGFDHPLTLSPKGYYAGLYVSPMVDDLVAEMALAFLHDPAFALGQGDATDLLALSFSAQDVVSHSYGNESDENLDVLRRLDLHLGRLLDAFDALGPRGTVALALSSDHGFLPIPEAEKLRNPAFTGGRLVNTDRTTPNFPERLNRLLSEELCLEAGSRPVFGVESWNLVYNRAALPMRTANGECGPVGRLVTAGSVDAALPKVVGRFFKEEIQEVLLASEKDRWPADDPAVAFALNDFDPERSGDAFIIPRVGVLMHWDPARGSGHGSHHEYETHVPLIFWGLPFRPGLGAGETTPYDLAPTLAQLAAVSLPDAIGVSRVPVE
jgi:hypothetical protein